MNDGLKPLIFLEPLSETLKKLKEVFEANAESEGVELYELDELEEAAQLIPNLGQSLILTASPKKCAMMLQQNRKAIKTLQTKTILLSPKAIPRKTLDKFMKVGLTECVIEPVNPKTLLYKVRLQLRSIKTSEEEAAEMKQKFGEDNAQSSEAVEKKVRSSKDSGPEEQEEVVAKKKKTEEVTLEDYSKPVRKNNYQEESIDGYYKGKKKRDEVLEDEEEEKSKSKYQEEAIEGHYKGKMAQTMDIELDEDEQDESPSVQDMEEDLEAIKHSVNLEVEEDLASKTKKEVENYEEETQERKKAQSIDIEEESEQKETQAGEVEDLGGHYKGSAQKKIDIEDEAEYKDKAPLESENVISKSEKKVKLAVEDEASEYRDKPEQQEESTAKAEKKKKLDLVDEPEEQELLQKAIEVEQEEDEPLIEKDEVEGAELSTPKKEKLDIVDDESGDRKEKSKADEIDGYLRGGEAKKEKLEADSEDLYKRDDEEQNSDNSKQRDRLNLDIQDDEFDQDEITQEVDPESLEDLKKKKEGLTLLDDEDGGDYKNSSEEEELADKDLLSKKNIEIEDDELKKKSLSQKEEIKSSRNRSDARADHIKTHYSSKESTKHNDDNWDAKWDKKKGPEEDFPKEKREDKSVALEKEDLGEQTIDYAQLKKEFEAGSYDGVRNKKKVYGEFHEVAEVKTYTKTVMGVDGAAEQMDFEEVSKEQKEGVEGAQVFEPVSLGIEIAIEVQGYYLEDDVDSLKICEFVQERISSEFNGDLVIYHNGVGDELKSFYNGRISKQLSRAPIKPTELDFEGLSRSEKKELESDYESDLKEYELKKRDIVAGFNQSWGTKLDQWKEYKTPAFRDHTFQELQNEFVFPFYEGASLLGMAIFIPTTQFNPERAESLEVVFEVMRGLLLTEYHNERGAGQIGKSAGTQQNSEKKNAEKSSGFFGKLFGKKAS